MTVKYQYAFDKSGSIIDVEKLERVGKKVFCSGDKRELSKFVCVSCERALIPALGKEVRKHFRHKQENAECNFESYLHKLAKVAFYETFEECRRTKKPFSIPVWVSQYCTMDEPRCYVGQKLAKTDLTKAFSEIKLETRVDSFIPDLLLTNHKGDRLFIEIYFTHKVSSEKVDSGEKIFELKIVKEDDIELIRTGKIYNFSEDRWTAYNFKKYEDEGVFCERSCSDTGYRIVKGRGKQIEARQNFYEEVKRNVKEKEEYARKQKEFWSSVGKKSSSKQSSPKQPSDSNDWLERRKEEEIEEYINYELDKRELWGFRYTSAYEPRSDETEEESTKYRPVLTPPEIEKRKYDEKRQEFLNLLPTLTEAVSAVDLAADLEYSVPTVRGWLQELVAKGQAELIWVEGYDHYLIQSLL